MHTPRPLRILTLALLLGGLSTTSQAALPHVQSQTDCFVYADIAVSSRALASLKIPADTARAWIGMVYSLPTGDSLAIAEMVVRAAYRSDAAPAAFAQSVGTACLTSDGEMDKLLDNAV